MPYGVAVQPDNESITAAKIRLRASLVAARKARPDAERLADRAANATHLLAGLPARSCIAAYLPLPTEPLDPNLLDQLARTHRVLVPVVTGAAPLDWCEYPGPVRPGSFGIAEPVGRRLGPDAITDADAVLIPALAVDPRGHRLGRGGGHYDRTLALRSRVAAGSPGRLLVATIYDAELLDAVPVDALDQPISAFVSPSRGITPIG